MHVENISTSSDRTVTEKSRTDVFSVLLSFSSASRHDGGFVGVGVMVLYDVPS